MNLELDLLELNALYVAVSNHVKKTQRDAEQYPSDFFETQATLTELLAEKIQTALFETCEELDVNFESDEDYNIYSGEFNFTDESYEETIKDLEEEFRVLTSELAYYVKLRDFRMASEMSERLDEVREQLDNLSK